MKIFTGVLVFFTLLFTAFQGYSYDLTEKDNNLLDVFEEKLFDIIDEKESVTPDRVEGLLEDILTKKLSDRTRTLIEVILDDLQYVYYLGEYGDVVYSEQDCYEDEYFDQQDQRCYFDDGDYDYDNESDLIDDTVQFGEEASHDEEVLVAYAIEGDSISLISGTRSQAYEDVWNQFVTLIPVSMRIDFKEYRVFDDDASDTGAHVAQDEIDNDKWNLTVNLGAVYENGEITQEGTATLIHEFAHVLTLSKRQMRYYPLTEDEGLLDRFAENCQTNLLQEGCLSEDAYLDDFIDMFWSDLKYLERVRNEEVYAAQENPSHFITDYAGTNPGEDIAESFTYFVLQAKPTGNTIADKKLKFFYNYRELANLRIQIRTRLAEAK